MLPSKAQANDNQLAEQLSNGFHLVLVALFGLLTSDIALHIAAKLI